MGVRAPCARVVSDGLVKIIMISSLHVVREDGNSSGDTGHSDMKTRSPSGE